MFHQSRTQAFICIVEVLEAGELASMVRGGEKRSAKTKQDFIGSEEGAASVRLHVGRCATYKGHFDISGTPITSSTSLSSSHKLLLIIFGSLLAKSGRSRLLADKLPPPAHRQLQLADAIMEIVDSGTEQAVSKPRTQSVWT